MYANNSTLKNVIILLNYIDKNTNKLERSFFLYFLSF